MGLLRRNSARPVFIRGGIRGIFEKFKSGGKCGENQTARYRLWKRQAL